MPHLVDGELHHVALPRGDGELVARAPDALAVGHHVDHPPLVVDHRELDGLPGGVAGEAFLFGEADGGEGAADTEPLVGGDGRPLDRRAELAGPRHRRADVGAGGLVDGDAHGHPVLVVPDAGLLDGLAALLLQQHRVGCDLEAVAGPGGGLLLVVAGGASLLVLVGDPAPVAPADGVELPAQPERGRGEGEALDEVALLLLDLRVERAAGVHRRVGHADLLHLLQVEEPLAVPQGVQGPDAHEGVVPLGALVVSRHGAPPPRAGKHRRATPAGIEAMGQGRGFRPGGRSRRSAPVARPLRPAPSWRGRTPNGSRLRRRGRATPAARGCRPARGSARRPRAARRLRAS